jgi:hypothetical protein
MFQLVLGKRGGRIGWKDDKDRPVYAKYIAHATEPGQIFWREPSTREVFDETAQADAGGKVPTDWIKLQARAVEIAASQVWTRATLRQAVMRELALSESAFEKPILRAIRAAIETGNLEEARTHDGNGPVHLIGPVGGQVDKRRDEIEAAREKRRQKGLDL